MLVEVAIQVPPPNRRSASEIGHGDMATIVVDDPGDAQPVLTSPRDLKMLGAPRDSSSDDDAVGQRRRGLYPLRFTKSWRRSFAFRC